MIDLLFQLPDIITPANTSATQSGVDLVAPGSIGFVILAIIVGPVILITLVSMFSPPRTFKVPGLFLGSLILLIGALVSGFAIFGFLLSFIVTH